MAAPSARSTLVDPGAAPRFPPEAPRNRWAPAGIGVALLLALALRLLYAWPWPDGRRFWDERYSFMNVRSLYEEGTFRPAKSYYPSPVFNAPPTLLMALSESLAESTGSSRYDALDADRILPAGYRWARGLQAVYGTLAVAFVYLAGVRLFGQREGFLAALMVAFMGGQIYASGVFKPDALLSMALAAALLASARQLHQPGWPRAIVTGLAISLAASAKLTGVIVAVPIAVVALALGRHDRRYWRDLALAGITSLVAFIAVNPYWTAYPQFIRALRQDYRMRAGWDEMSRLQMPARVLQFVTSAEVFGKVLGAAALLAFSGLIWRALSPKRQIMERANAALIVIFPVAFTVSYGLQTPYFKRNQFLVVVPFLALALGWLAVAIWLRLSRGYSSRATAACGTAILTGSMVLAVLNGSLYVYRALVPTTIDLAKKAISHHAQTFYRHYLLEAGTRAPGNSWELAEGRTHNQVILEPVESLAALDADQLALADGWIFAETGDSVREFIQEKTEGRSGRFFSSYRYDAQWLEVRGPSIRVVSAWPRLLPPLTSRRPRSCGQGCLEGRLQGRQVSREALTFSILIPVRPQRVGNPVPTLEVNGTPVRLLPRGYLGNNLSFQSVRVRSPRRPSRWVMRAEWPDRTRPSVELVRWKLRQQANRLGQSDVVGIGQRVEPGQIDPGQQTEGDHHERNNQE